MSRTDYDLLSTSPPDEPCVQGDDSPDRAQAEGKRYIELIRKVCGPEPEGAQLKVRSNPHDLGTYYTVALFFDDDRDDHIKYMQRIELDGPLEWDEEPPVNFDYGAGRNPNF
jgi:hypothetical protein